MAGSSARPRRASQPGVLEAAIPRGALGTAMRQRGCPVAIGCAYARQDMHTPLGLLVRFGIDAVVHEIHTPPSSDRGHASRSAGGAFRSHEPLRRFPTVWRVLVVATAEGVDRLVAGCGDAALVARRRRL